MILHNPFGPIFEKELRATSRRKRTYALRSVYLGGLLLFLVLAYLDNASSGGTTTVTQRVQAQNQLGQQFFILFSLFCVGSMAMIGPVLTCTAISAERLHKTLHVLLMTPITAWQIVTGKLFSRLLVSLTLIGLSLPVLALVRLLGGVDVSQMFGVLALAIATAVVTAAMGLFLSTFLNRAYAAILFAYGAVLVLWVFGPILFVAVSTSGRGPPPWQTLRIVCTISPFLSTAFLASPVGPLASSPWAWCVGVQLALATVLVVSCALVLRRIQRREGHVAGVPAQDGPAFPVVMDATDASPDSAPLTPPAPPAPPTPQPFAPVHWRARTRRDVGDNPVLWRELGCPLFTRKWQSRAAGIAFVALLLVSYICFGAADVLDDREVQVAYAIVFNGLTWLVLAVLSATAIAQEKESDTWTLLLATPIRARQIVVGKIVGIYRRMLWPFAAVAAHFAGFALFGVISWTAAALVMWIVLSFNAVWVATGLYLSLKLRKVTFAVIINLMIAIVLYLGGAIVLGIAVELMRGNDDWAEMFVWGLPYFYLAMGVYEFKPGFDWTDTLYLPGVGSEPMSGLLWGGLLFGGLYLLAAGTIVLFTLNRFNRIVGRADQVAPLPPTKPLLTAPAAAG